MKQKNERYFDSWINIHKPHCVFMKFCGFGSNGNIQYYTKIIVLVHSKKIDHLIPTPKLTIHYSQHSILNLWSIFSFKLSSL
jgi:hypothetical protein